MSLYQVGETWYAYITHKGARIRRSTGTADREEAQRLHDQLRAELWRGTTKVIRPAGLHTWTDAVAAWLEGGAKGLSDRYMIKAFGIDNTPLCEIDTEFLHRLLKKYKVPSTRNRHINTIHAILAAAKRKGLIDSIPHIERSRVTDSRIRWLTTEEWERLERELPCHMRQAARFALATGLRENNVIELEWSQVDMKRRVAWVHPDRAKAKKAIGIPLSDNAMRVLEAQKEAKLHSQWVFVFRGNPVTKCSTKAWWEALARAGIENFTWHDLRHTWASWHVMAGTPIEVLQKLGGWATLDLVLKYAHLAPEHLAGYVNNSASPRHS